MYIVRCAMWYIILVTAFTNFLLDATTGLQHGVLLQILLSITLIFHSWSIMIGGNHGMLNLKKIMLFHFFSISAFICVHSQPTKIMFADTKYNSRKQILSLTDFSSNNPIS